MFAGYFCCKSINFRLKINQNIFEIKIHLKKAEQIFMSQHALLQVLGQPALSYHFMAVKQISHEHS